MSSLWRGTSGDERFVGRGGFSDLNKEYSWKNQAGFGEAFLHAAVQCRTGVAAEGSVGYQWFQNSSISFCHSRGSNRGYHLSLQIWSCFSDGRLGLGGKVLVVGSYKSDFSEKLPEVSLCLMETMPVGSKTDVPWPKLSPSAKAGSTSGITYLIATETQVLLLQGRKTAMEKGLVNN